MHDNIVLQEGKGIMTRRKKVWESIAMAIVSSLITKYKVSRFLSVLCAELFPCLWKLSLAEYSIARTMQSTQYNGNTSRFHGRCLKTLRNQSAAKARIGFIVRNEDGDWRIRFAFCYHGSVFFSIPWGIILFRTTCRAYAPDKDLNRMSQLTNSWHASQP